MERKLIAPNNMTDSISPNQSDTMKVKSSKRPSWTLRNPFVFRVGTLMTGIGVGCGLGVGIGSPINLAALPGIGPSIGGGIGSIQSSMGGVSWQVQKGIRFLGDKFGIKGLKAGVGCGAGVGYGFGVGLALKPGVGEEILQAAKDGAASLAEHIMAKWGPPEEAGTAKPQQILAGILQGGAIGQGSTVPVAGGTGRMNPWGTANPGVAVSNFQSGVGGMARGSETSRGNAVDHRSQSHMATGMGTSKHGSRDGGGRAETSSPTLNGSRGDSAEVDRLRSENEQLRALLRHENEIVVLKDENASLKKLLAEVLDLQSGDESQSGSSESDKGLKGIKCFACRRLRRRR